MRLRLLMVLAAVALGTGRARGQEAPKYDVLKKMYDDTVAALKASQEAKNQLATKNEELTRQAAELQKQLEALVKERDELQRQAAGFAERTYALRSTQAAWQEFLRRYPALQARWKVFLEGDLLKPGNVAPTMGEPQLGRTEG